MKKFTSTTLIEFFCICILLTVFAAFGFAQDVDKNLKSTSLKPLKQTKPHQCDKKKNVTNNKPKIKQDSVDSTDTPSKTDSVPDDCKKETGTKGENANTVKADCQSPKKSENEDKPLISEVPATGTFDGDLRDLPNTKPIQQKNPNREAPKTEPKVLPKKKVIKP